MTTSGCVMSVVDGIVTNLSAASVLGSNSVGKDYSVLGTTQDTSAVVGWGTLSSIPVAFGGVRDRSWTARVELFIKDVGSPSAMMDNTAVDTEKVLDSLESDATLQNTVDYVNEIRAARTPGVAVVVNEIAYYPIDIEIDFVMLDN